MSEGVRDQGVVVLGHGHIGFITDESLTEATTFRRTMVGDSVVSAVVAARTGLPTALITRIGDDPFGPWLLEQWEAEGIHLDFVRQIPGSNPVAVQSTAGAGQELLWREGAAPSSLDASDVEGVPWELVSVLYVPGSIQALGPGPREAARYALQAARAAGVQTVHAPMLRSGLWPAGAEMAARAAFDEVLPLCDLLVIEAPFAAGKLLGQADATEAARAARDQGVRRVVIRQRDRGCILAEDDSVNVVQHPDPTSDHPWGAAMFQGSLIADLGRGQDLTTSVNNALAAEAAGEFQWKFEQ
jgi:sugar/nucleoside kinase (ribokinase family)